MNPLNLPGPQFLLFYAVLAGLVLLAGLWLRWWLRASDVDSNDLDVELTPYEVTYLAGAEGVTFDAAAARLVQRDVLTISKTRRSLTRSTRPLSEQAVQVEQAIHEEVGDSISGSDVDAVRKQIGPSMLPLSDIQPLKARAAGS